VRKATDMSRMMAQLTMDAITATLKPKVSCGGTAVRDNHQLQTCRTRGLGEDGSGQALSKLHSKEDAVNTGG
jgi:hypothetical protein